MRQSSGAGSHQLAGSDASCVKAGIAAGEIVPHWREAPRRWGHSCTPCVRTWRCFRPRCRTLHSLADGTGRGRLRPVQRAGHDGARGVPARASGAGVGCESAGVGAECGEGAAAQPCRAAGMRLADLRKQYRAPSDRQACRSMCAFCSTSQDAEAAGVVAGGAEPGRRTDRYLMAVLLGILHLNARTDGTPRGLSVAMPNTFSMAPGYVSRYVKTHELRPPQVDVFDALEARVKALGCGRRASSARGGCGSRMCAGRFGGRRGSDESEAGVYVAAVLAGDEVRKDELAATVDAGAGADGGGCGVVRVGLAAAVPGFHERGAQVDPTVCAGGRVRVPGDWGCASRRGADQPGGRGGEELCWRGRDSGCCETIDDHLPVEHKVSRIWGATKGGRRRWIGY